MITQSIQVLHFMFRKLFGLLGMMVIPFGTYAQTIDSALVKQLVDQWIQRSPVKTGLTYDKLTQFYQSSVSTGDNGGFDIKASLFGVKRLFATKDLNLSKFYNDNKSARDIEFGLGVHNNTDGKMSTINASFTWAAINRRSKSFVDFFSDNHVRQRAYDIYQVFSRANIDYQSEVLDKLDKVAGIAKAESLQKALAKYNKSKDVSDLPEDYQTYLNKTSYALFGIAKLQDLIEAGQEASDEFSRKIENRSLLTLVFSPGYDVKNSYFDTTTVSLNYLVGIGQNHKNPWNLDAKLQGVFGHDTLASGNNLSRHKVIGLLGINKVLWADINKSPILELEVQGEDQWVTNGNLYTDEKRHTVTANSVLRIHLSKEVILPITLKYDVKDSNLLGILRLQWNLENGKDKN